MSRHWYIVLVAPLVVTAGVQAQTTTSAERWLRSPSIVSALAAAEAMEPETLDEQVRLCEVPAPPFAETARARLYRDRFADLGLQNVRIDAEGNVLGERPGQSDGPHLVISAHLDTVFPEGTDVRVTREGPIMRGPGIGDDCRGLAVLLAVVRAMDRGGVTTEVRSRSSGRSERKDSATCGASSICSTRNCAAVWHDSSPSTVRVTASRPAASGAIGIGCDSKDRAATASPILVLPIQCTRSAER